MKQSPELDRIQGQMAPGVLTRDGFLGNDRRCLAEIIDADCAVVHRIGVTHAAIAARMRDLRESGKSGLGLPVRVPPHFEVQVEAARGRQPCPFGGRGLFGKTTTFVTNVRLGEQVQFSDLQIHMIGMHGFYEGTGSRYRIDPERLVLVLEVPNKGEDKDEAVTYRES